MATEQWATELTRSAKTRANIKNLEFDIDAEYVLSLFCSSGGRCQLTGIPFIFSRDGLEGKERRPYAPSIDRIDHKHGYTKGNVRLVCASVNIAMNNWGFDVLLRIARALIGEDPEVGRRKYLIVRRRNSKRHGVRWEAKIKKQGTEHHLGTFNNHREIMAAYDAFMDNA